MKRVRKMAVTATATLTVGLAGCGDGQLSKPQFVREMDRLCSERDEKARFLDEGNLFSPQEGPNLWARGSGVFKDFVGDVEDLDAPGDAKQLQADYVRDGRRGIGILDQAVAAGRGGDTRRFYVGVVDAVNVFAQTGLPMAEYGARRCAEESLPPAETTPAPGAASVPVGAREYAFDLPETVNAGKTAFVMANRGNEIHIFGIGRFKPGATFEQLRAAAATSEDPMLLEEETEQVSGLAAPGGQVVLNTDLKPGTYAAFCFIPAPDGQPHLAKGMLGRFTVR